MANRENEKQQFPHKCMRDHIGFADVGWGDNKTNKTAKLTLRIRDIRSGYSKFVIFFIYDCTKILVYLFEKKRQ